MIVCSCNIFTDKDVREALQAPTPPATARQVYAALGCAPKCGCCARTITELLQETSAEPLAHQPCCSAKIENAA